jgi:ribulose-phosphate 3-epimerase
MPWDRWIRTWEVEPSVYAADFSRLGHQIDVLARAGARIFHFDVGDGHLVPPITMGPIVLQWISPIVHRYEGAFDCHLMVERPERQFEAIAAAGGDSVTFHFEAVDDVPATEPEDVAAVADGVDLVLCMSIHPGYSGQEFMPDAVDRVARLRELLPEGMHIQVDGGIDHSNLPSLLSAGADLLVVGTAIFEREDLPRAYRRLVQALA